MRKRILIFSTAYLPFIGGSELAIKETTDRMGDFDFDLITAKLKKDLPMKEKIGNVMVHRVGYGSGADKFLLPLLGFFKARSLINGRGVIMHAYQASHAAGAAYLVKIFFPRIPLILTLQEGKELDKQNFFIRYSRKMIVKKTDAASAISGFLKDYLLKLRSGLRVDIIPNGVDIDNFSRQFSYGETAQLEEELGLMPDDKVIITVSRLVPKNGVDLLVEALAVLNGKYKLIIAGEGPMKDGLLLKARDLGIKDRIIFAGTVGQKELPLFLKISDVFVRPSRSEGLGSAFLEAMAAGVPVVGTNVGGIPDILEDRKTGLICSHEPQDIAFKIRILIENDNLRREVAANASEMIKQNYDWNNITSKIKKLYESI